MGQGQRQDCGYRRVFLGDDIPITLTLTNKGFQAVEVMSIAVGVSFWIFHAPLMCFDNADIYDGPNLPMSLQANTTNYFGESRGFSPCSVPKLSRGPATWRFNAAQAIR